MRERDLLDRRAIPTASNKSKNRSRFYVVTGINQYYEKVLIPHIIIAFVVVCSAC